MKINSKLQNSDGVVVILVLWVLVILTSLAISLGKNAHIEMSLTKNSIGKIKSKYIAQSAIAYALNQIALDSQDTASNEEDNLYYCGIRKNDAADLEELFKNRKLGDGTFSLFYKEKKSADGKEEVYEGFSDEERRINLNALTLVNINIFIELLQLFQVENDTAKTIGYSVLDWIDQDGNKSDYRYGAEDDYYEGLGSSYKTKNRPFQSAEELLFVREMTPEILARIKPYISIYPANGNLMINFDTASEVILQALARSFMEVAKISPMDADSLVDKIMVYREGKDGQLFTADDEVFDDTKVSLDASERSLLQMINQFRTKKSNYFRINAEGKTSDNIKTRIEAIVSRETLETLSWHRF